MKRQIIISILIFASALAFYLLILKPEKYTDVDLYEQIIQRGRIRVGINTNSRPFGFVDKNNNIQGYEADLAKYIAQYILKSPERVEFVPVTPANRIIKASTGEVDIVIATLTITPQRAQILNFSVPYDYAGQALLVKKGSKITSIADLNGESAGVVFGTTAEKNMKNLAPGAKLIGFHTYDDAYRALLSGKINVITSDDMILNRYAISDSSVKLLPKRYSREPYGIGFKKGAGSERLKEELNFAIKDMKQKNIIPRLKKKWGL